MTERGAVSVLHDPLYDPLDPAVHADPYPGYRRLREVDPVHRSPLGYWLLTRYADVALAERDPRFGRGFGLAENDLMLEALGGSGSPVVAEMSRWMLLMDPPDHTRLRTLVSAAFYPRALEAVRPRIGQIADQLLSTAAESGTMDLIADFAYLLPVTVISQMLGLPIEDHRQCREWADALGQALDPFQTPERVARASTAVAGLTTYIRRTVDERRRNPGPDILSALIAVEQEGDRLSEEELVSTVNLLFLAGHETTVNLIGNGMLALLRNPDQMDRLRSQPQLIQGAVEELLRYDSPVQLQRRWARQDIEIGEASIAAGDRLVLLIGAGNRDPARFANPDELDVGRGGVKPLSFGGGIHFCLGAMLARIEAQIAISTLLSRLPGLELVTEEPQWRPGIVLRGLKALPVSFSPPTTGRTFR